jgi:ankyrin repeat protein
MQDGRTPAHLASQTGATGILELLLTYKADINAAAQVQQFKIFKYIID